MRISIFVLCGLFFAVTSLSAQTQPVTTLSNAELFSRQYAQADTTKPNIGSTIVGLNEENSLPDKRRYNSVSIIKTTVSGTMWGGVGLLVGGGFGSFAAGLFGAVLGGGSGAIIGVSSGTYFSGRKYRKGNYMNAFVGTILPA